MSLLLLQILILPGHTSYVRQKVVHEFISNFLASFAYWWQRYLECIHESVIGSAVVKSRHDTAQRFIIAMTSLLLVTFLHAALSVAAATQNPCKISEESKISILASPRMFSVAFRLSGKIFRPTFSITFLVYTIILTASR